VLAGVVCAAVVGGETGQILALVLVGSGLVGVAGLAFMEVGLSEDRERERDQRRAERDRERRAGRLPERQARRPDRRFRPRRPQ
jgi:hypothetical protein